jgi:hypothetical protein
MVLKDCLRQIAMSIRDVNGMTEDVVRRNAKTLQVLLSIVVWRVRQFWQLFLYKGFTSLDSSYSAVCV